MYGSHDSLTGYKPRKWWMYILQPFSKTQNLTIEDQIANGVRCFDIRVRYNKKRELVGCHGFSEYRVNVNDIIKQLEFEGCYYRVILENVLGGRKTKETDLAALKAQFISPQHPHCIYVTEKKNWFGEKNEYCNLVWKEQNCFKDFSNYKFLPIPRLFVKKYSKDKFEHSLNFTSKNIIYYYDFVELKR